METAKNIIFLLTLAVLVISPVQSEETQAAQISNTRTANCLVKVTCDPAILPMNLETLDYLLHSSGVGGKARREVLDISPDQDYDLFTIDYVHLNTSEDISALKPSTGLLSGTDEYEYAPMMERGGPSAGSSRRDSSSLPEVRQPLRDTSLYQTSVPVAVAETGVTSFMDTIRLQEHPGNAVRMLPQALLTSRLFCSG